MKMVFFVPPQQRRLALLAAQADTAPALIYGASGTGKGAIAKWIHTSGPRAACSLVEAKIANHTVVSESIQAAQGGTVIVHEIGAWPLAEQLNLLNYLKTKTVTLPSGMRRIVNSRVIATTSQSLEGRAQGGLFNPELLEKLNVFRIEMPPLVKRIDEFDDIVLGIVGEITRELHKEHLRDLSPDAWSRLRDYDWPGNIRELRNVLKLSIVAAEGDVIEDVNLPEFGHHRIDFRSTREEFERTYLLELLRTFNWEVDKTCRMTKMPRSALIEKMTRYGLTPS